MDTTKLLDKAKLAFERSNYDYAIDLYLQLLEFQPNHLDARKTLRAVEIRKYQELGITKSQPTVWLKGVGSLAGAFLFSIIRKHEKAMAACEAFLKKDPHNATVLTLLAQSAAKAGFTDTAIQTYEDIRGRLGNPKNKVATRAHCKRLRALGDLYDESGDFSKATQCFEEVRKYYPFDRQADIRIRDLAARRSMAEGRWEDAGRQGYRAALEDEGKSQDLEQAHRDIRTREDIEAAIVRVTRDLEKEPDNTRYLTQLGDHYKMLQDWAKARETYEKAQAIDPSNFMIQERLGDLELAKMDEEIKRLDADEATKAAAKPLLAKRTRLALEEYTKRAKARPQDFDTRYKLAEILFQFKKYKEAATHYQLAARDPKTRRSATYRLGLCLEQQGMLDLAIEQYLKAAEGASVVSQDVKDVLYTLGHAFEEKGRFSEALDTYKRVFDTDMNYRDISAKIQALYSKGAKEPGS